uniref:Uncharacterized protein n=1 Tax=Cacopsylla melanoneura TaxID=428564 RepID=A0A8D9F432_9HEMI
MAKPLFKLVCFFNLILIILYFLLLLSLNGFFSYFMYSECCVCLFVSLGLIFSVCVCYVCENVFARLNDVCMKNERIPVISSSSTLLYLFPLLLSPQFDDGF